MELYDAKGNTSLSLIVCSSASTIVSAAIEHLGNRILGFLVNHRQLGSYLVVILNATADLPPRLSPYTTLETRKSLPFGKLSVVFA
jgi:hypothetical protein